MGEMELDDLWSSDAFRSFVDAFEANAEWDVVMLCIELCGMECEGMKRFEWW